jgi:hypothetical protein
VTYVVADNRRVKRRAQRLAVQPATLVAEKASSKPNAQLRRMARQEIRGKPRQERIFARKGRHFVEGSKAPLDRNAIRSSIRYAAASNCSPLGAIRKAQYKTAEAGGNLI